MIMSSLKAKLIAGFFFVSLISFLTGFIGMQKMTLVNGKVINVSERHFPYILALDNIKMAILEVFSAQRSLLIQGIDKNTEERQFTKVDNARAKYIKNFEKIQNLSLSDAERKDIEKISAIILELKSSNESFFCNGSSS